MSTPYRKLTGRVWKVRAGSHDAVSFVCMRSVSGGDCVFALPEHSDDDLERSTLFPVLLSGFLHQYRVSVVYAVKPVRTLSKVFYRPLRPKLFSILHDIPVGSRGENIVKEVLCNGFPVISSARIESHERPDGRGILVRETDPLSPYLTPRPDDDATATAAAQGGGRQQKKKRKKKKRRNIGTLRLVSGKVRKIRGADKMHRPMATLQCDNGTVMIGIPRGQPVFELLLRSFLKRKRVTVAFDLADRAQKGAPLRIDQEVAGLELGRLGEKVVVVGVAQRVVQIVAAEITLEPPPDHVLARVSSTGAVAASAAGGGDGAEEGEGERNE